MLTNETVALSTSKVLLVPYSKHHVPTYHEWMKDPKIQEATASEPLTIDEEYSMQESWRKDSDKLTFVICHPAAGVGNDRKLIEAGVHDSDELMIGDVNMFITTHDGGEDEGDMKIVGELELMVAKSRDQGKGYGRTSLLAFMRYILEHEKDIVNEFLSSNDHTYGKSSLSYFCAKIGEQNLRSVALFESIGFRKTSTMPSYFGEFELRHSTMSLEQIKRLLERCNVGYAEIAYGGDQGI